MDSTSMEIVTSQIMNLDNVLILHAVHFYLVGQSGKVGVLLLPGWVTSGGVADLQHPLVSRKKLKTVRESVCWCVGRVVGR